MHAASAFIAVNKPFYRFWFDLLAENTDLKNEHHIAFWVYKNITKKHTNFS